MRVWLFIGSLTWLVTRSIASLYRYNTPQNQLIMNTTNKTALYGLPTMMQIRADRVIGYHDFCHSRKHLSFLSARLKGNSIRSKAYSGRLSNGSRKRLTKACQIMACVSPQRRLSHPINKGFFNFRLAFVTLTFPIDLKPGEEKAAPDQFLKPLIQTLQRRYGVINYVWRAELTSQNRVHFHLLIDQPVNYLHLRNAWNRLLRKARLLDGYARENGHYNANSTDIRKVKSLKQALRYTSKYISKDKPNTRAVLCKVWDSSTFLKGASWSTLEVGQAVWFEIIKDLKGTEDGVYLQDRFFVVANRYIKSSASLKSFLIREITEWVTQMRVACGWLAAEFINVIQPIESPILERDPSYISNRELAQLQFLFPFKEH